MAEPPTRISAITVRGFKSICTEQTLAIKPLTVLAGANSSGKSSFMQPLLLLKQTLESPSDPGALLLNGPNVKFTKAEQLLSRLSGGRLNEEFGARISFGDLEQFEFVFFQQSDGGLDVGKMIWWFGNEGPFTFKVGAEDAELDALVRLTGKFRLDMKRKYTKYIVRRQRFFLGIAIEPLDGIGFMPSVESPVQRRLPIIDKVIHLPGLRGNPQRAYQKLAAGPNFPGTFDPYVASVIAHWQTNGGQEKLEQLGRWLELMGLTWKVRAERVDDTAIELQVGRLPHEQGGEDLVSIADVGFGVSQCLPVLVALLAAGPGQLVYLEQPEIHLHPYAQRRLAVVLKEAADRGAVVVAETHSALLVREIQTLIAANKLNKDNVALHWVKRDEKGHSVVTTADLDDTGAYGDWPEDFDRTELDAEKDYLDAVEAKEAGK